MNVLKMLNKNLLTSSLVFSCVEIVCFSEDIYQFNYLLIKHANNKLNIITKEKCISKFTDLKKYLKKDIPIVIAITGKGILNKKIDKKLLQEDTDYLKYVLPNAVTNDFITQVLSNEFDSVFCAVARRQEIEKITNLFKSLDLFVVNLSLGVLSVNSIISLLNLTQNKITLGEYKIQIKNKQFFDISQNKYRKQDCFYKIGEDELDQELITAFSAGFQYFILDQTNRSEEADNSLYDEKEFNLYKRFKTAKIAFLICCFILLLINFFVYDHFNNLSNELSIELSSYDKMLTKNILLKKELESKEEIVKSLGLKQNNSFSFIADQIASTVISTIIFSELNIYPIKSTRTKEMKFVKDKIVIAGTVLSANELNNWIKKIRGFDWIENLVITDFKYSDKESKAKFEIKVILSNSFI